MCGKPFPPLNRGPMKCLVQAPCFEQLLNLDHSNETALFQILKGKVDSAVSVVKLLGSQLGRPLRLETGQNALDFIAIYAVTALVGAAVGSKFDATAGNGLGNYRGQFANAIVLIGASNVENLLVHEFAWGTENADDRSDDVANMDDRAPRSSIAFDVDLPFRISPSNKVVEDNIEAQARGYPVGGSIAHKSRTEVVVGKRSHVAFDVYLGFIIWGNGIESS